eukprot:Hpha_TRINITY_DN16136_c6_g6::TRINITY_DN16136_c6_g6_i1::g.3405::m.3405
MKFGREITEWAQRLPQYKGCFVNYKELKLMVKECFIIVAVKVDHESDEEEPTLRIRPEESRFFLAIRQQQKEFDRQWLHHLEATERLVSDLCRQLALLLHTDQLRSGRRGDKGYDNTSADGRSPGPATSFSSARSALSSRGRNRHVRRPLRRAENQELFSNIREAYKKVLDIQKLRWLATEAFRKIIKKYDKTLPGRRIIGDPDHPTYCSTNRFEFDSDVRLSNLKKEASELLRNCLEDPRRMDELTTVLVAEREVEMTRTQEGKSNMFYPVLPYLVFVVVLIAMMFALHTARPNFRPLHPELNWQGYVVVAGVMASIFAIAVLGVPSDFSMMSATTLFLSLRIITLERAFIGFGNPGVIANGILLPFARGLMIAGGAERLLVAAMGGPGSNRVLAVAQVRMSLVVATFSSVLNNTPIVYMMIPILQTWCTKVNHSVSKFMMPMSFAIMLGGTWSIIGSSANLVAVGRASTFTGHYPPDHAPVLQPPAFFMPAWVGLPVALLGSLFMTATAPWLLPARVAKPSSDGEEEADGEDPEVPDKSPPKKGPPTIRGKFSSSARFVVAFRFTPPLLGLKVSDTGVTRALPGVGMEYIQSPPRDRPSYVPAGDVSRPSSAAGDSEAENITTPSENDPLLGRRPSDALSGFVTRIAGAAAEKHVVTAGDLVVFYVRSQDVNVLRQMQGLELISKSLDKLGTDRRQRCLMEATLRHGSSLIGRTVRWDAREGRTVLLGVDTKGVLGGAIVGAHFATPGSEAAVTSEHESSGPDKSPASKGLPRRIDGSTGLRTLCEGDTLLIEAGQAAMARWEAHFDRVAVLEDSTPPMRDRKNEILTVGSLAVMVMVTASGVMDIVAVSFIIVPLFVMFGVLSPREAWGSVKGDVLLTVAASFGIGEAMTASGLASWLGTQISTMSNGSELALLALLYAFTVAAGTVLNNAAVAVLVYPVAYCAAVEDFGLEPSLVVILVIMGAGLSFSTPMSYQTNQMVQEPGGYTFADYVRFGGCLQVFTGVASVLITYYLAQLGFIPHYHGMGPPPCSPNC